MRRTVAPEPAVAAIVRASTSWLVIVVLCAWLIACLDAAYQKKALHTGPENESKTVTKEQRPPPTKKLMASLHHDLKDLQRLLLKHYNKKSHSDKLLAYLIDANGYRGTSKYS